MVHYTRCSDAGLDVTYRAFRAGFCDYAIPLDMPQDAFVKRFFGPEGNATEHSFVAIDDSKPVGLVLGGIRSFDGMKTMRCGTMCVVPAWRMRGVAVRLFELHREEAQLQDCRQLFLEVIQSNLPAVRFYKRCGYTAIYDIHYYSYTAPQPLPQAINDDWQIHEIDLAELKNVRRKLPGLHINWQNEIEYIEKLDGECCFGIYGEAGLEAALSIHPSGRFHFIWITPAERRKGLASALLNYSLRVLQLKRLDVCTPNNATLECFLTHCGFKRDKLAQFEMYLSI